VDFSKIIFHKNLLLAVTNNKKNLSQISQAVLN